MFGLVTRKRHDGDLAALRGELDAVEEQVAAMLGRLATLEGIAFAQDAAIKALQEAVPPDATAVEARIAALADTINARLSAMSADIMAALAALSTRVGALEAAPPPVLDIALEPRVAALEAKDAQHEAELQTLADPYAAPLAKAGPQIARWAALERLLIGKNVVTEAEVSGLAQAALDEFTATMN